MTLDHFLFMAEAEGIDNWVDTKQSRINAAINDFVSSFYCGEDINDSYIQSRIFSNHNLSNLSFDEKNYIISKVNKNIF